MTTKQVHHSILALFLLYVVGMLLSDYTPIPLSLTQVLFVIVGIFFWFSNYPKEQLYHQALLALTLCFFALIPSVFYTKNFEHYSHRLQLMAPFLLLPLASIRFPKLRLKDLYTVYAFFLVVIFFVGLTAFVYYLFHIEAVNELYLQSKVMPALIKHHPTLSVMVAFCIYIAYHLVMEKFVIKWRQLETLLYILAGCFLFLFEHIFSVRIGLLTLYSLVFFEIVRYVLRSKQYLRAIIALIVLIFIGGTTLWLSPTFSNKLVNTTEDLKAYKSDSSANNRSLSSRLISYKNAFEIAKENSVFLGCGIGDMEDINLKLFQEKYPDVSKPITPHHQFLFLYASVGILGLILFCVGYYYPVFQIGKSMHIFLKVHYIITFLIFQVEEFLDNQLGVAFTIFFLILGIYASSSLKETELPE